MKFPRIRPGRTLLSVAIIGAGLWGLGPSLTITPSIDAVVNAEVVSVRSVTEGRVTGGPPSVGTKIERNAFLARIVNPRQNQSFLGEIQTERASLNQRIEALDRQRTVLKQTAVHLAQRVGRYRISMAQSMEYRVAEAKGILVAIGASLKNARRELARSTKLMGKGLVAQSEFDEIHYEVDRLVGERSAAQSRLHELEVRLASVRNNTFLSDGQNDVPYSQQRLDEISIRLSDIEARRSEYVIRVAEIARQITAEALRLEATREMALDAPVSGIIWKRFVKPGNDVVIGTELVEIVDCNSVFLDATFDEDRFAEIRVGQQAKVRFVGSDEQFDASVRAIRGSGAITEDRLLAARTKPRAPREFQAILEFDPKTAGSSAENFCLIGRSAEVAFTSNFAIKGLDLATRAFTDFATDIMPAGSSDTRNVE